MTLTLVRDRLEGRLRSGLPGRLTIVTVAALASAYRGRLRRLRVVAITGTSGKTTAKELTTRLLAPSYGVLATRGTENYLSPVARTLLRARRRHEVAVLEIGTSHRGNIAKLAALVRPDVALVTAIGDEHRDEFPTRAATALEKGALVGALPPGGVALLNADDAYVRAMAERTQARIVTFGCAPDAELRAENVESAWPEPLRFTLHHAGRAYEVTTRLHGKHWLPSVLGSLGVAVTVGVPLEQALATLATVEPTRGRMEPYLVDGIAFIRDDFKSAAWGYAPALEFLGAARAQRKLLVAGRMGHFVGDLREGYRALVQRALEVADELVFAGPDAWAAIGADAGAHPRVHIFETVREASTYLDGVLAAGDLVLVKGRAYAGDHIGRVALTRTHEVRCWRSSCGRWKFCDECALLTIPAEP